MKYQVDKKIEINKHSGGLYSWCLNEVDLKSGKKSEDLIPFLHSLFFTGSSFRVIHELSKGGIFDEDVNGNNLKTSVSKKVIVGLFHPGYCSDGEHLDDDVHYYMFGSDRAIKNFTLRITCSDAVESLSVDGCPAYSYELDFSQKVSMDFVEFSMNLNKSNFDELIALIDSGKASSASLVLSGVSGFYSDWSPSIRTGSIKILSSSHVVDNKDGVEFKPQTLGNVFQFNLTLTGLKNLDVKPQVLDFDINRAFEIKYDDEVEHEAPELLIDTLKKSNTDFVKKLGAGVVYPLWIIVFLLVLSVFR